MREGQREAGRDGALLCRLRPAEGRSQSARRDPAPLTSSGRRAGRTRSASRDERRAGARFRLAAAAPGAGPRREAAAHPAPPLPAPPRGSRSRRGAAAQARPPGAARRGLAARSVPPPRAAGAGFVARSAPLRPRPCPEAAPSVRPSVRLGHGGAGHRGAAEGRRCGSPAPRRRRVVPRLPPQERPRPRGRRPRPAPGAAARRQSAARRRARPRSGRPASPVRGCRHPELPVGQVPRDEEAGLW